MLKLASSFALMAMTIAAIIGVDAAPSNRLGYYGRRSDSSSSSSSDYSSDYYKWVPVEYSKCTSWSAYSGYNLVKAESYDKDKTDIYVCLVKFSDDNSYRIGWFDPSVSFVCTVVYQGEAVEAKDDTYHSYFLSIEDKYEGYWATWDELSKYQDDQIVYAPDHDCVTGEVCWTENSGGGFTTYSAPNGDKTGRWGDKSDNSGGSSNSNSRRAQPQAQVQSWTRNLGRRDDYNKGNNEYAAPTKYCYIGYGSSVTNYKVFYAYEYKAYQSDDIRYDGNVKVLVIIISDSGSGYNASSSGSGSGDNSGSSNS